MTNLLKGQDLVNPSESFICRLLLLPTPCVHSSYADLLVSITARSRSVSMPTNRSTTQIDDRAEPIGLGYEPHGRHAQLVSTYGCLLALQSAPRSCVAIVYAQSLMVLGNPVATGQSEVASLSATDRESNRPFRISSRRSL